MSPPHDVPVQNTRCSGLGQGSAHEPWRGLGHRGTRVTPAYRHPPVEPALCHRGFPTVAGEGWGARSRALAAAAGPGHPPDCVLARGGPPRFHPHTTVRSRAPGQLWGLHTHSALHTHTHTHTHSALHTHTHTHTQCPLHTVSPTHCPTQNVLNTYHRPPEMTARTPSIPFRRLPNTKMRLKHLRPKNTY